jgi:hypothetical protein
MPDAVTSRDRVSLLLEETDPRNKNGDTAEANFNSYATTNRLA